MKKRLFKTILYWGSMGLCVVLGRWIIDRILNRKPFSGGYFADMIIGVSTFMLVSLVAEFIKIRKEKYEEYTN
ncbi:hypothetical protein [Clostridium sp. ZS2-4]|uniref:hypothetical protein n=1 Tax=Clostridium sp. ZS2-4 TaxID=2987703 RepID=UPI00227B3032|nr:hypothetical protein [Clostridium sp. ZS2-4]MCY6356055.1 hypothetical protein [Clostridium sp. ZS2-4]